MADTWRSSPQRQSKLELAKQQHDELLTALQAFVASLGGPPSKDIQLRQHARERQDIVALLSAFTADGHLIATIAEIPRYSPRYRGADSDVIAQARFLYQTEQWSRCAPSRRFGSRLASVRPRVRFLPWWLGAGASMATSGCPKRSI